MLRYFGIFKDHALNKQGSIENKIAANLKV